ncbi:MAG: DUF4837 family protein [Prevotella sp.]
MVYIVVLSGLVTIVGACGNGPMLPHSGMRPYEVLLVAADAECGDLADSVLSLPVPGLSQYEPQFDVSLSVGSDINETMSLARSIVIIETDSSKYGDISVKYERDAWAHPQIIVRIGAPTIMRLREKAPVWGRQIATLITRFEINEAIASLREDTCAVASKSAATIIGWTLKVPGNMNYIKRGKDFIWFSDNGNDVSKNICLYTYPGTKIDGGELLRKRDSIMSHNLPGERSGMYMCTVREGTDMLMQRYGRNDIMVCRALWEMKGDAMGGPFVCHAMLDGSAGKVVVAEAFVYAPSSAKRNVLRHLEAMLYTLSRVPHKDYKSNKNNI